MHLLVTIELLLVKEYTFYDVFTMLLGKQSVSHPSVKETGARSSTGK